MNEYTIRKEIEDTVERINAQIEDIQNNSRTQWGSDIDVNRVQDKHGAYVLTPLLVAKASLLSALVDLGSTK